MWMLIQVDNPDDVNKDEKQRVFIGDNDLRIIDKTFGIIKFEGKGSDFHPATPESED